MSDLRDALESARSTASKITERAAEAVTRLAVVAALTGWLLFGLNLARLHYRQGDITSALFSTAVAAAPLAGTLGYYTDASLGVDVPSVDFGSSVLDN